MTTNSTNPRDRRDWTLIIFLLPIGILLMVLAGQFAIRMVPSWSVDAGMGSSLDPQTASGGHGLIPPISFDILTPMSWLEGFLTPGPDSANGILSFPPFVVFEPSATPVASVTPAVSNTPATPSGTPAGTTTPGGTATHTKEPPGDDDGTSTATSTTVSPTATTPSPTATTPSPTATTPSPTATTPSPTATTPVPITSTPAGTLQTGTPVGYNEGAPDGSLGGNIADGQYYVITLGSPIIVNPTETGYYDFVYYESYSSPGILMDRVILSISSDNAVYYVVFHWGDGVPDTNSNVGDVASSTGTENDNQSINSSELHGTPPAQTGILVDVDNAPSHPPAGSYNYLAIQAPATEPAPLPTNEDLALDVDSVEVTEVPIATP